AAAILRPAEALDRLVGPDDQHDRDREGKRSLARDPRDLREALPEDVAEQAKGGAPGARAQDVVGEEAPVGQAGGAGCERHQRPYETDPTSEDDRLPAVVGEVVLDLFQALLGEPHAMPVLDR